MLYNDQTEVSEDLHINKTSGSFEYHNNIRHHNKILKINFYFQSNGRWLSRLITKKAVSFNNLLIWFFKMKSKYNLFCRYQ